MYQDVVVRGADAAAATAMQPKERPDLCQNIGAALR